MKRAVVGVVAAVCLSSAIPAAQAVDPPPVTSKAAVTSGAPICVWLYWFQRELCVGL